MKRIQIKSIAIRNFKGIKDFTLKAEGCDVEVSGDNDAGKTTIYDAFLWCLFHKDSKDRSQFKWKPLDSENNYIHGLQASTTVELIIDGTVKKFHKEINETKGMRRKTKEVFYDDVPKYSIDDLEISTKTQYDELVSEVVDQQTFKNLTSVTYFCEQLSPEQRREALFNYFGTMNDLEIIQQTPKLKGILDFLNCEPIEDCRLRIAQAIKKINTTLKEIPVRIETIQELLPDVEGLDQENAVSEKGKLQEEKNELLNEKSKAENGSLISDIKQKINEAALALGDDRSKYQQNLNEQHNGMEKGLNDIQKNINSEKKKLFLLENQKQKLVNEIASSTKQIEADNEEADRLRREFYDVRDNENFQPAVFIEESFDEHSTYCPTCKRAWDPEAIEEMKQNFADEQRSKKEIFDQKQLEALKQFDLDKKFKLETIQTKGSEAVASAEALTKALDEDRISLLELEKQIVPIQKTVEAQEAEFIKLQKTINDLKANQTAFEETAKYKEHMTIIEALRERERALNENVQLEVANLESKIKAIDDRIFSYNQIIAKFTEREKQEAKISEIQLQEKELSEEKGEMQERQMLIEEFYITKRDLLQEKINSNFQIVKWKLFDFYEEGGLNESVCEPMINGVPFSNLNNGSRIKAGIDVSNTLMKQEGVQVPIFIDNAEGVTRRQELDTQVIALKVNARNKNLKVELKTKDMEGVA